MISQKVRDLTPDMVISAYILGFLSVAVFIKEKAPQDYAYSFVLVLCLFTLQILEFFFNGFFREMKSLFSRVTITNIFLSVTNAILVKESAKGMALFLVAYLSADLIMISDEALMELSFLSTVALVFILFLVTDWMSYHFHKWQHHRPILWQWHQIHHNITGLRVLNLFRAHPIDFFLRDVIPLLVVMLIINSREIVFSVAVLKLVITSISHFKYFQRTMVLNKILVTPDFHRIHHDESLEAPVHFGVSLSIFDTLHKTRVN